MSRSQLLTTSEIGSVFQQELAAAGGKVTDLFDDGRRLYGRSVLNRFREVRKADRVQAGVAIRATEQEVWVHPYVFRLVCRNGAIMAHAEETVHLDLAHLPPGSALAEVREGIRACCADGAFETAAGQMKAAAGALSSVDLGINMLAMLSSHLPGSAEASFVANILDQYFREGDASRYGLMNAVTAVAREIRDPETRWRLEKAGGGIAVAVTGPEPVLDFPAAEALPLAERQLQLV